MAGKRDYVCRRGRLGAALRALPRACQEGGAPEPAPGVGEDFVASSIRVSPDGERLAVIGRLNPNVADQPLRA